jgi:hypothetical protein
MDPAVVRLSQFGRRRLTSSYASAAWELAISAALIRSGEVCAGGREVEAQAGNNASTANAMTLTKYRRTMILGANVSAFFGGRRAASLA